MNVNAPLTHDDYTVGWICALPVEMAAAKLMLDKIHSSLPRLQMDQNTYTLGSIGKHNVVIASLPSGAYGSILAATVGMQLLSSFHAIRVCLMVGIGGGVPSSNADIRLGDIVVSQPTDTSGGVIQYDIGRVLSGGQFQQTGILNRPPKVLLTALATLQAHHRREDSQVVKFVSNIQAKLPPRKAIIFARPTQEDCLFQAEYDHIASDTCIDCDRSKLFPRPSRDHEEPVIHYGLIGSANQVVKDGKRRDQLARVLRVYCLEMEAAGLMNDFPCLVVRGISDYADSHKNREWQGYAAIVSAAYAKELLLCVPIDQMNNTPPARDTLSDFQSHIEAWLKDESQDCLRSLAFPQMRARFHSTGRAIEGTCEWLLKHEVYERWATCDRGVLWIKGAPGTGKSTLLRYALENGEVRDRTLVLSFFFNGHGSELERTLFGLFRSLLHQILVQAPEVLMDLVDTFQKRHVEIGEPGEKWQWHPKELWLFFESSLLQLLKTRPVRLFVDALDECGEDSAASLVEHFNLLFKNLPSRSIGCNQFLVCFTCRPYPILDMKDTFTIWLEQENGRDISTFVNERLSAFPGVDESHTGIIHTMNRGSPRSEKLTEDYPPSTTAIIATESSAMSQGFWSSGDAQGTVNASTTGTSVLPSGQKMDQDLADLESIYTSDVPRSLAYVKELASSFFRDSKLPDAQSLERIRESLPDLLRGFAQRIGGENDGSIHFEVMKFIYKNRRDIATSFGQCYLEDNEKLQRGKLDDMSLDERLGRWQVDQVMDDPNSATTRPDDVLFLDNDAQLDSDDEDDEPGVEDPQLELYRNVVASSTAFQWLLCRLHREASLTTSEASSVTAISTQIRQVLYSRRENCLVSSQKGPAKCSVVFQSDWDPLAFIRDQGFKEEPEEAVEGAIVIVQSTSGDTEAMPCSEYVGRTWPLLGEQIMGLVKHTVQSEPTLRCSVTLFDKTKVTSWVEPSGCFSLEAAGIVESIVEVGEVFAFITAALRSAQGDSIASLTPFINGGAKINEQKFKLTVRLQNSDGPLRSTGQCWQDLFRNPVVIIGFPVRRRRPDQEPGLEISLATLAALVGTRRIAVFCGKFFFQGFCTMLVPTKYAGDTVHWHVLFNENGSRISFTDSRIRKIVKDFDLSKHLTLSGVEAARHIVGWCEQVRNYAVLKVTDEGSREASYVICRTGLPQPGSRFAFDRVSISAGKIVTVGGSMAICKKDKPARAAKATDYHKQIEWVEERFIVLYDCKDRRAWLIDGLSALLRLVRSRLAHRRKVGREVLFSEDEVKEPDTPHTGKTAANAFFRNRANMDLKIYEKWNRIIEETSQKGEEPPETNQKTQKTWEQLPDLVGDIYTTLGMLFDIQTDTLTADGFEAKVHKSPRRHLEGWDFQQVATGIDPLLPKAALLRDVGLGWVDLVRAINGITLFGVGFGEIIQPVDVGEVLAPGGRRCNRWATLPRGEELLATTTPVIRDIMENVYRDPDNERCLWELFTDIYWHSPDKVFEVCHCGAAPAAAPGGTQCDRVQVLLPTKFPKLFARGLRSPPKPLPAHGAVVFGHSVKFPLVWKLEACSIPTEGHLQPPQLVTSESSQQSDSGLAMSVASSSVHTESVSRDSSMPPASSRSSHGAASNLSFAPATGSDGTIATGKSASDIFKRLLRKTRPGAKSDESFKGPSN